MRTDGADGLINALSEIPKLTTVTKKIITSSKPLFFLFLEFFKLLDIKTY